MKSGSFSLLEPLEFVLTYTGIALPLLNADTDFREVSLLFENCEKRKSSSCLSVRPSARMLGSNWADFHEI